MWLLALILAGPALCGGAAIPASTPTSTSTPTPIPTPLTVDLPDPPTGPCASPPALRAASSAQVEQGNEAAMRGDPQGAVDRYRAALSIDRCSPFAWADLGEALMDGGRLDLARESLSAATRLMPRHYRAWTNLGRVEESRGQPAAAIDAYEHALHAHPDHVPAMEALRRLGSR